MTSAIDDLITFARGLIPPGATESEEARTLEVLAGAVKATCDLEEKYRQGYNQGRGDEAYKMRREIVDLRNERDAARRAVTNVRRGARCLRERCKRLEAQARMAEQAFKAHIDAACERGRRIREALIGASYGKRE